MDLERPLHYRREGKVDQMKGWRVKIEYLLVAEFNLKCLINLVKLMPKHIDKHIKKYNSFMKQS